MSTAAATYLPLSYAIALMVQLCPLPYHVFGPDRHYVEKFDSNDPDNCNVLKTDYKLRCRLLDTLKKKQAALFTEESPVLFAGVECLDGISVIVGPVVMTKVDQHFAKLYSLKHGAESVPLQYCQPARLSAAVLLIYSALYGRLRPVSEFLDEYFLSDEVVQLTKKRLASVFSQLSLEARPHNPVSLELNIRRAIRAGDVQALKVALNSPYSAMRGTLASDELRSAQNLAIVDITIATREAIDSGLSVEELYMIADAYILQVEDCRFPADCDALARACALRCTQMVKEQREKRADDNAVSSMVRRACDYIDRHLYEKADVGAMAAALRISPSYLSRIFHQGTGQTISAYARQRKMELAASLLSGSDKSLHEIAQMLGFSSQSHFGRTFLTVMGVTPGQYRAQHQVD